MINEMMKNARIAQKKFEAYNQEQVDRNSERDR